MLPGLLLLMLLAAILAFGGYVFITAREMRRPPRISTGWALARNMAPDPAAIDLPFDAWTLDLPDGVQLPVWDIPASGDQATDEPAPTLVILHGWGHSRINSMERLRALLSCEPFAHGMRPFRTILFDLRGHGDSSPGPSTLGDRDVEDVLALIERIAAEEVFLLGHSLGAYVAIRAAALQPDTIRGVIALAPYDRLRTPINGTLRARSLPHGRLADIIARLASSSGHARYDVHASARLMQQPLAVFAGGRDKICPQQLAASLAEAAPEGSFTLLEECRHGDHHVLAPEALAACLDAMLTGAEEDEARSPVGKRASRDVGC